MNLINRIGLALLLFVVILGLVGCPPTGHQAGRQTMSFRLSPFELASRLGMDVSEETDRYIELKNTNNRVVIFIHEGGRVFVNQKAVGSTGPIARLNSTIYLPEHLEPLIRSNLNTSTWVAPTPPKPKWIPPTPGKKGGLIVIDPGHGGKDPGTTSYLGHAEKGINLRIANKVVAKLKAKGFDIKMTRSSDSYIDKYDRAELTNKIGPDLFVSIHCDSLQTLTMRGYTVYVSRSASQDSRMAAGLVEDALTATGLSSRGVRQGDYVVLVNTKCPAVLVECGCLSNPREAALLYDNSFQEKIATAIANGIAQAMARI